MLVRVLRVSGHETALERSYCLSSKFDAAGQTIISHRKIFEEKSFRGGHGEVVLLQSNLQRRTCPKSCNPKQEREYMRYASLFYVFPKPRKFLRDRRRAVSSRMRLADQYNSRPLPVSTRAWKRLPLGSLGSMPISTEMVGPYRVSSEEVSKPHSAFCI